MTTRTPPLWLALLAALALSAACDTKPGEQHRRTMTRDNATAPLQRADYDDPLDPERSLYLGKDGQVRVRLLKTRQYTKGGGYAVEMLACKSKDGKDLVRMDYEILNDGPSILPRLDLPWSVVLEDKAVHPTSDRCPLMQERSFGAPLPSKGVKRRSVLFEIPEGAKVKAFAFDPGSAAPGWFKPGPVDLIDGQIL
jgi:hypothetical protein